MPHGFVEQETEGLLKVHGFMERNGSHLREADRKRIERENKRRRTVRGPSADAARTRRGRSAPTGRDGTGRDGTKGLTAGRQGAGAPTDLPPGGKELAARFTNLQEAVRQFPKRDVDLIALKLQATKPDATDRDLLRWCESAERNDTERRADAGEPEYDFAAVIERAREIDRELGRGDEGAA